MTFLLGILIGAALGAFGAHAAFQRGYALGERHGQENAKAEATPMPRAPLSSRDIASAVFAELDRTKYSTLGLNGTRAQALEHMR